MCGICGISGGKLSGTSVSIFEDLMIVSNLRGRWGAGVCVVTNKDIMTYKTEWSGVDAIDMKGYREKINGKDNVTTLLGHTRHPTKGGQTVAESHPHVFDNVTGVHNGTLSRVDGKFISDAESDSRMFYQHMNRDGFDQAIAYAQGAYCFVWIDHETETLNFIRNTQRPMTIAKIAWGSSDQTIVWASEKEFLELVLKRRDIRLVEYVELPVNEHWSIPLGFKRGDDFKVVKGIFGGSGYWSQPLRKAKGKESPSWSKGFQAGSSVKKAHEVKKTYIFKDGEFVEKDSIMNPPAKKVSLPGPQANDELEGAKAVRLLDGPNSQGRVVDKQRPSPATKISLGSNAAAFLKNLTSGIRKEEAEFYGDTVVDLFPKKDSGPNYEQDNQKIESEFEKLLAQKDTSNLTFPASSQLWEDCQYESDSVPATRMRETLQGHYIPEDEYFRILKFGCAWTGDPAVEGDVVHWVDRENFILDHVTTDPEAMADLALVYPSHPKLKEWLAALKPKKAKGKDVAPHHVTIH